MLERFKKEIGDKEVTIWHGAYSALFILFDWANQEYYSAWHRTPSSPVYFVLKGRDTRLGFCNTYYEGYARDIFTDYYNGEKSLKLLEKTYSKIANSISKDYYRWQAKDLKKISDEDLRLGFEIFFKGLSPEISPHTIYIETFDYNIALQVLGNEKKAMLDALWEKATHPAFESFEMRQLRLTLEMFNGDLNQLARKVQFMFTDYFEPLSWPQIIKILEERVGNEEKIHSNRLQVKEYNLELERRQKEFKAWFKTLDKESKFIAMYIQYVMELRDRRKDPIAMCQAVMSNIVKELLNRAGIDEGISPFINGREIVAGGRQWLQNHSQELLKRPAGMKGYMSTDGGFEVVLGEIESDAKELDSFAVQTMKVAVGDIKGQVASQGIATGVVRVIQDMSKLKEFNEGDILVTGMTRPEFVSLMKKAGAIITDEGGITCHAAIVSRELKKPCIIGTKVATKVLKDGDVVEVDANSGIIKKI